MLRAGDLVLLPFPFTDLSSQKRRPALVLRDTDARGDFIALAVTSQPQPEASTVIVQDDLAHGVLPRISGVRVDTPYPFNARLVAAQFGSLKAERFQQLSQQMCKEMGCHEH